MAKRFGVTREEVCHYVTLLKRLPADLVQVVTHGSGGGSVSGPCWVLLGWATLGGSGQLSESWCAAPTEQKRREPGTAGRWSDSQR